MKKRIFISSVIEGFEAFRSAVRSAVENLGAEPVMANELTPSVPASSRNLCLDLVGTSDFFLLVLDLRPGWKAPSGRFVVEEGV